MSSGRSSRSSKNARKSLSCSGDISAPGVAERLVTAAEETGLALRGVVHSAAVIDDQIVAALSRESLERVWAPKAAGALRLHACHGRPRARLVGGVLLDVVPAGFARAGSLRLRECVARCLGRVATCIGSACHHDQLGPVVRHRRGSLIDLQCSRSHRSCRRHRGLGGGACRRPRPGWVSHGCAWIARAAAFPEIQQLGYFATLAEELDVDSDDDDWAGPDALRDMDAVEANRVVTARLGGRILAIMGYPKDSAIDADQPLTELGMDSLMAVRIRNTVRGDFGVEPPVALLLQGASLADLTADLIRQLGLSGQDNTENANGVRDPSPAACRSAATSRGAAKGRRPSVTSTSEPFSPNAIAVVGMAGQISRRRLRVGVLGQPAAR